MKVGIQVKENRLILVWNDGKRRTMAIGLPDSTTGRSLAKRTAAKIEIDFHHGEEYYDRTLLKYKPRTIGKTGTEISTVELFDRFTKHQFHKKGLAQSSVDARYKPTKRMLEKYLNIQAANVDKRRTEKFADVCKATIKDGTSKERIGLLKSAWNWAEGQYQIAAENPWKGVTARFKRSKPRPPVCFTESEVSAILQEFRSSFYYSHYAEYIEFQLGCATRPGEAAGLRWKNLIDYQFKRVLIAESFSRGKFGETKTGEDRLFMLRSSVSEMLIARHEQLKPNPDDLVFFSPTGLPQNDRNFRRAWTKVLKAADVPYKKPYTTRGTALSRSVAAGHSLTSVSKAAGNSPKVLEDHYLNVTEDRSVFEDFD